MKALATIHAEHRTLGAVLHGLVHLVREIRDHGAKPDFALLGAMTYYIDTFPERHHHPKEDNYLFKLLRARHPDAAPLLDELQSEHVQSRQMIRLLEQALARYQHGGAAEFAALAEFVENYAAVHWEHMRKEEDRVMPLARAHLTADDWEAIDAAFAGHTDPLFGAGQDRSWDELFRRIVHLAPPPIGVGPMR